MKNSKSYYSLNDYLKSKFGQKVYKISLNAGLTCPNRDGTIGTRGCIFCSSGGSGDFAASSDTTITQQIEQAKLKVRNKINNGKYIAYFQAYTNTYGPIEYLESIFNEAISHPDIVALSIATRPDCINMEVLNLIESLNKIKPVWVELGLQTVNESTAQYIRRGYRLSCFEDCLKNLQQRRIDVITHVIIGLPGENKEDLIRTIQYLGDKNVNGVKLQLLHVLKDTDLAVDYFKGKFEVLSMEQYIDLLMLCIQHLPDNIVIHRLTGDGPKSLLIAPLWSANKKVVLNSINAEIKKRNIKQGEFYIPNNQNLY